MAGTDLRADYQSHIGEVKARLAYLEGSFHQQRPQSTDCPAPQTTKNTHLIEFTKLFTRLMCEEVNYLFSRITLNYQSVSAVFLRIPRLWILELNCFVC
jgi:hypothetical protein